MTRRMAQERKEKPKMKIRRRHVKRGLLIAVYAFVAIVTVIGIVAPALQ